MVPSSSLTSPFSPPTPPFVGKWPVKPRHPSLTRPKDPVLEFGKAQGAVCEALDSEEYCSKDLFVIFAVNFEIP